MPTSEQQLLQRIIEAANELDAAKLLPCKCSALVIQHEGGCQCERGKQVWNATQNLNNAIAAAQRFHRNAEEKLCTCGHSEARHQIVSGIASGFCKHCPCEEFVEYLPL